MESSAQVEFFFGFFLFRLRFSPSFYAYVGGGGKKKPKVDCVGVPAQSTACFGRPYSSVLFTAFGVAGENSHSHRQAAATLIRQASKAIRVLPQKFYSADNEPVNLGIHRLAFFFGKPNLPA